ncbi:CDP-diacylglycerol-inositol 3-phosphatidyltransferase, putative [Cryptococcus deneoformans JEC21]|uniref:CDP-diacylglycerol-inositol 3-phosphatidyltransferase, putative n=2 Tax=Cryptococcus deneoformans TaxID=40410 RepID=Q5KCC1_CRYD1|nr:CDP-diacylglycerol-inositol 3-phosphatidyltransferase, putative [Cryptococcus neoformans var. neoformans JEC21]AAW44936.2 CDP-diacylglycerol-inositol 3-phosphatidyltransferase, putative [Cryptococcus neoformans var. neoformans JEC21]
MMAPTTRSKQSTPVLEPEESTSTSTATSLGPGEGELKQRAREGSRSRTRDEVWDPKYAVDLATTTVDENVFLFVPNLIGYTRVITAAASLFFMPYHPKACTMLYSVSCMLDVVDGQAARALGQTSRFGAVLDMVTDRCTTACLLCFLSSVYPTYSMLFMFLITLDFSSHYIHMYSSLTTGSSSHKTVTSDVSRILWYYYNDSRTLFVFCFANELFFVCLYLNHYWTTPLMANFPIPTAILTSELTAAHPKLVGGVINVLRNLNWPQVVAAMTFPICAGKQIINVVQFWKASKILVGVDLAERRAAREQKLAAQLRGR